MKLKGQTRFKVIRIITDIMLFPLITISAYSLKFKIGWFFDHFFNIKFGTIYQMAQVEPYLESSVYLVLVWLVSFYFSGVYKPYKTVMAEIDEWVAIGKGTLVALILTMALTFIFDLMPESRFFLIYIACIGSLFFSVSHYIIYQFQLKFYIKNKQRVLIVGHDDILQDIIERIITIPSLALGYIGTYCDKFPLNINFIIQKEFKQLGKLNVVLSQLETINPDIIFISAAI